MAEGEAERPEAERLVFRVGVRLGDVIVDGDDLYGDGVNVATAASTAPPPKAAAPAPTARIWRTVQIAQPLAYSETRRSTLPISTLFQ